MKEKREKRNTYDMLTSVFLNVININAYKSMEQF